MNELRYKIKYNLVPTMTVVFMAINIIVFVVESFFFGDSESYFTAMKFGAYYYPKFVDGQWYRLFTSCFVHFGFEHLFSNMLGLFAMGMYVEKYFGKLKFTIFYILSGLGGSLMILFFDLNARGPQDYVLGAGASGSIFGLVGIFIVFALSEETKDEFPLPRVLFGIILIFIPSFMDERISLKAHAGGFIVGLILGMIFMYIERIKREKRRRY